MWYINYKVLFNPKKQVFYETYSTYWTITCLLNTGLAYFTRLASLTQNQTHSTHTPTSLNKHVPYEQSYWCATSHIHNCWYVHIVCGVCMQKHNTPAICTMVCEDNNIYIHIYVCITLLWCIAYVRTEMAVYTTGCQYWLYIYIDI